MIPLSVPNIAGNEKKYVCQALDEGWVSTAGRFVTDFEKALADYTRSPYAVACQSGSAGLHLALRYVGAGPDTLVLAPTLTFIASINAIAYTGASPLFLDCDDSLCMNPDKLEAFLLRQCEPGETGPRHKATGRRIAAMLPVHIFGNLCDMARLMEIAHTYRLPVVEDATEALGSHFTQGPLAGQHAGTFSEVGVFSFNGNKILTTGGGGMLTTADEKAAQKLRYWSTQAKDDEVYFVHGDVGYNYRLTNIQAAMGLGQMELLEDFIAVKERNYRAYANYFMDKPYGRMLPFRVGTRPNYWFYSLALSPGYEDNRDALLEALSAQGVQTRPIWTLNHLQKPYRDAPRDDVSTAEGYQRRVLNLPCSTSLAEAEVETVCAAVDAFFRKKGAI